MFCCYPYCLNKESQNGQVPFHFIHQHQRQSTSPQRAGETLNLSHTSKLPTLMPQSFTCSPKAATFKDDSSHKGHMKGWQQDPRCQQGLELNPFILFSTAGLEIPAYVLWELSGGRNDIWKYCTTSLLSTFSYVISNTSKVQLQWQHKLLLFIQADTIKSLLHLGAEHKIPALVGGTRLKQWSEEKLFFPFDYRAAERPSYLEDQWLL